jgi:RimJ/RimL family protein N-acetyltransferase
LSPVEYERRMLYGDRVGLRARLDADVPILYDELYSDVPGTLIADGDPWVPKSPGRASSPFAVRDPVPEHAGFSVVELDTKELIGVASLWGIHLHNRLAHLGIGLRPAFRGRGFGLDTVRVLCHYGFVIRGLHRLQIDTLADNDAMIRTAERAGFRREGVLRGAAYIAGRWVDEIVLGQLADEWPT